MAAKVLLSNSTNYQRYLHHRAFPVLCFISLGPIIDAKMQLLEVFIDVILQRFSNDEQVDCTYSMEAPDKF